MPVTCQLRVLLARLNVERAKQRQPAVSVRQLAEESGISLSVVAALHTGRSQRIDYGTLDRLLTYFSRFFAVTMDDLLVWGPSEVASGKWETQLSASTPLVLPTSHLPKGYQWLCARFSRSTIRC